MIQHIHFWNGNKSPIRQQYELQVLTSVLHAIPGPYSNAAIINDTTDYPLAVDEGNIFRKGADVCVTVAGNTKFADGDYIPLYTPLAFGLLGHRMLIIRRNDAATFSALRSLSELATLVAGVPNTWADANLFRANGLAVNETGNLDSIFAVLADGGCDYIALGANEITSIFAAQPNYHTTLALDQSIRMYYPMALVFYVNPSNPDLAQAIQQGLNHLVDSAELMRLFDAQFASATPRGWSTRNTFTLINPNIPDPLQNHLQACRQLLEQAFADA